MRNRWTALLACIVLAGAAGAQVPVRILSVTFVPVRPYVGDVVECVVVFDPGAVLPEEGALGPFPPAPPAADMEFVEAVVRRKSGQWIYSARMIPWATGSVLVPIPSFSGLSFPDVRVDVASVMEDFGREPPRYKDPMELKGTRLLVWGLAGGGLAAVLLAWSLAFGLIPWIRRMRKAWREGRAGRDFGRSLNYLEKTADSLRPDEFWALLVKALRKYMGACTRAPYESYTAREALSACPDGLPEEVAVQTAALISEGDAVRFARTSIPSGGAQALARSREILRRVEEADRDGLR